MDPIQDERRPIPGLDGYDADTLGRIWRTKGKRRNFQAHVLNPAVGAHGYFTVRVFIGTKGITKSVHSLVTRAFHGERLPGCESCHRNGDRHDNRPSNLRWGTSKENTADRARHGRLVTPRGPGRGKREDVTAAGVRALHAEGLSVNEIARRRQTSWGTVRKRLSE